MAKKQIEVHSGEELAAKTTAENKQAKAAEIIQTLENQRAKPMVERELTAEEIKRKAEVAKTSKAELEDDSIPQYTNKLIDSTVKTYTSRMLLATPTTGIIRMEWAAARYGMAIPSNFSKIDMQQYMSSYMPIRYTIADAQNMIINEAVTKNYEWLVLIEDDTIPPPDGMIKFNEYIRSREYPVVSGLYFTRSDPADPMVYRGRGNSFYTDWKLGDKVMVDGVPTGMLLLSVDLLRAIWNDAPEYMCGEYKIRRVMDTPVKTWFNEESNAQETLTGTSDLDFCTNIIEGGYLAKAGWPELQKEQFPFLVDTSLYCKHIDRGTGVQYPLVFPAQFFPEDAPAN
jgi:hypothetical protein